MPTRALCSVAEEISVYGPNSWLNHARHNHNRMISLRAHSHHEESPVKGLR